MSVHTTSFDVLIVGNGVLGLFLANRIADRQIGTVAVIGPDGREFGASNAAGAMLGSFGEVTRETLLTPAGRMKFEAGLAAHHQWGRFLDELDALRPDEPSLRVATDTFVMLNTIGGELDTTNYEAIIAALREYGEPYDEVDPSVVPGYRPRPDQRALRAIRLPSEGAVDGRRVLRALEERGRNAGVTMISAQVESLTRDGEAVTGVVLRDGTRLAAGTVVVAAGAASSALLHPVLEQDELMPTFAGLGFAAVGQGERTGGFSSVVRTPNRAFACGLHVVPLGDGREYLGATNAVVSSPRSSPFLGDAHFLADCAMRQLNERIFHHEIVEWRVGNRPVTLDHFPLIGALRKGLHLMTGTYRDGFHCAPVWSDHVAAEIEGKTGEYGAILSPHRELIASRTVAESVEEYVRHRMAAWFEAGAQSPPQVPAHSLAQTFHDQATAFYERIGVDFGLGPDLLMYLLNSLKERHAAQTLRYLRAAVPAR